MHHQGIEDEFSILRLNLFIGLTPGVWTKCLRMSLGVGMHFQTSSNFCNYSKYLFFEKLVS